MAANSTWSETGWQGSYDYNKLAKYADYLVVMAYDEHFEGGDIGPVAGIDFVKASIEYAISKVDNQKIVVGVPFYGRFWKEGETIGGQGITINKIESLIKNYES